MNLKRLKYFVKIVDMRSLTKAAEALHIAQPALSQQLAILESEMEQQLVIRSPRGISVTAAGETLYRHAQSILRHCEDARMDVLRGASELGGKVTLGLVPGPIAADLAFPLFSAVHARHPAIMLSLIEGSGAKLDEQVLSGHADIAVLYDNERDKHGIHIQRIARESLVLVGPASPAMPSGAEIPLAKLETLELILPRLNAVGQVVDDAFSRQGIQPRVLAEVEAPPILHSMLGAKLGYAVLAESLARTIVTAADGLRIWHIADPPLAVAISIYTSSYLPLSDQAKAVLGTIFDLAPSIFRQAEAEATQTASH